MRPLLVVILFITCCTFLNAQTSKPIRWNITLSKNEVKQGEVVEIIMKADINTDWYLYSSDFSADLGPTVTSFTMTENGSFKVVGGLKPYGAKEKYDSLWGGKIRYFVGHAEFRQKIKILKVNPVLKGILSYQVCSDKEGKCIPFDENILFDNLKVIAGEVVPDKGTEVVETTTPPKDTTKPTVPVKRDLASLEAEKEKLIKKDNKGKDIAVEQLKTFSKKYGGGK